MQNNDKNEVRGLTFAAQAAQTFFAQSIVFLLSLATGVITARLLGPSGRGIIAVVTLYPAILYTLGHLSIYRTITVHAGDRKYLFEHFPATVLVFAAASSLVLAGIFLLVYRHFNYLFLQGVKFSFVLWGLCLLPFLMIKQIFNSLLQTKTKIAQLNIVEVSHAAIFAAGVCILLFVIPLYVNGVIFSYIMANGFSAVLAVYFVKRISRHGWRINVALLKRLIGDGLKLHIGVIANFICLRIDMLMLAHYRQSSDVGYYAIAVSVAEILVIVPSVIQTIFYSRVVEDIADGDKLKEKTFLVYKHSLLVLFAFSVLLAITAKPLIIFFYGDAFAPSFIPFIILLPGVLLLWLNNILTNYLVAAKRFLTISAISAAGSVLNVYLNTRYIPVQGAQGAALASTVTYGFIGAMTFIVFLRALSLSVKDFLNRVNFSRADFYLYSAFYTACLCRAGQILSLSKQK